MKNKHSPRHIAATATWLLLLANPSAPAGTVIDYHPGTTGSSLSNPYASLGIPGAIVGMGSGFDSIYSLFNPHYEATQITQIGEGGDLTLRLDSTVNVTPGAAEIGIFTNVGLVDSDFPNGLNNLDPFGVDSVLIDVSQNGRDWTTLGEHTCDFPGNAFTDAPGPFHPSSAGLTPADFSLPHQLQLSDIHNKTFGEITTLLAGSAGGTWIDLDPAGLAVVAYIRFRVPDDGNPETDRTFELASVTVNRDLAADTPPTRVTFVENFADNPIGSRANSDPGHASYEGQSLTVDYDLSTTPKRTSWPLDATLTDSDSFSYSVEFTINTIDFDSSTFGQLSFGLINSATTGSQRTMSPSDSWDLLTVDYFPNPDFTTLTPTVIGSQGNGQTDAFANLGFPSGSASIINEPGEIGQLPTGTALEASIDYDASDRTLTLRLHDQQINASGPDPDGDATTIEYTIPADITFELDTFALLCWQEPSGGTASLTFHHLSLTTPSPTPNYYSWADANIAEPLDRAPGLDANADGLSNLLDYALGGAHPSTGISGNRLDLTWLEISARADVTVAPQSGADLRTWSPAPNSIISAGPDIEIHRSSIGLGDDRQFLRLEATRP